MVRLGWLLVGWLCVGIGGIGVVVPGLPSTGFFIMAAGCFSKSSPRFERWVLGLPGIGPLVVDYRAGLGMPKRTKIQANAMMWIAITISAGLVVDILPVRLLIVTLGLIGSYVIVFRVPTKAAVAWTSV